MRNPFLLIISILSIGLMTSCNESITPLEKVIPASSAKSTNSVKQTLLNSFWQYGEINIQGGSKTKLVFSRQQNVGLNNTISKIQINFKTDGTIVSLQEGLVVQKGKWKLLNNDKQLELAIENSPVEVFNIVQFNKDVIEYNSVLKPNGSQDDAWTMTLAFLGASPSSVTEITTTYKLSPI